MICDEFIFVTFQNGSTPLHMAVAGKHDEMVEILLEGNADVNATDNENRSVKELHFLLILIQTKF